MLVLNSNLMAQAARQALLATDRQMSQANARLSTGARINSAADDAAGLAISNKLQAHLRGYAQAQRNANDGVSMLQVADSAGRGIQDALQRMRELAVQAMNDTYSTDDRNALDEEFQELQAEIGRTLQSTQWGGFNLFDGSAGSSGSLSFHVGPAADDYFTVDLGDLTAGELTAPRAIADPADAADAITSIDTAMNELNQARTGWGASMNRLTHAADAGAAVSIQLAASRSRIADADYAQNTAELARAMIMRSAGTAMLTQANSQPRMVLALLR